MDVNRKKAPRSTKKLYAQAVARAGGVGVGVALPASWFQSGNHAVTVVSDVGIGVVVAGYDDLMRLRGMIDSALGTNPFDREGK